jgi:hypothetical protein
MTEDCDPAGGKTTATQNWPLAELWRLKINDVLDFVHRPVF